MKKRLGLKSRLQMSLLLCAVILFTQCKKSGNEEMYAGALTSTEMSTVGATTASVVSGTLNVSTATSDGGYAYVISQDLGTTSDSNENPTASKIRIFENGIEIGPAHSLHSDIRTYGKGRFSHKGTKVYFSASDNTNPRTNGRKYTYTTSTITEIGLALNVSTAISDGGYAYVISQDLGTTSDSNEQPTVSTVRIFENGQEIGPAHSLHSDIRTYGKGRFSHKGTKVYFSASDNTNPKTNGRKYTYTTSTTTSATTSPTTTTTTTTTTATTSTSGPIGFASVDGTTTGGKGGQTVTVSTLSALKTALTSTSTMIIYVSGTITGTGNIYTKSNKSIIGLNGATLNGVGISAYGVSNIIIQNLKIQNVVGNDAINIKEASHHIWVDHCDLSADRTHGWDYYDGLLDITVESNYITVSWTKIHDSHKACLVGGGLAGHESDRGKLKVTYHNNYFYNLSERAPNMKYGHVHMFNNYHLNNSGYSIAALAGGIVRTDNNYFSNCNRPFTTTYSGLAAGYISGASSNTYVNSGSSNITTAASSWVPTYEYKSALTAASNVPSMVTNGAGPK